MAELWESFPPPGAYDVGLALVVAAQQAENMEPISSNTGVARSNAKKVLSSQAKYRIDQAKEGIYRGSYSTDWADDRGPPRLGILRVKSSASF